MQIYVVNVEWFALWVPLFRVHDDLWAFGLQVLKAVRKTWRFAGQLDRMQHERRLMPWNECRFPTENFWSIALDFELIRFMVCINFTWLLHLVQVIVLLDSILKWNQWTFLSPTWMLVHVWSNHWLEGSWFLFWDVLMFIGSWWFMHLAFPMASFVSPSCEKPVL